VDGGERLAHPPLGFHVAQPLDALGAMNRAVTTFCASLNARMNSALSGAATLSSARHAGSSVVGGHAADVVEGEALEHVHRPSLARPHLTSPLRFANDTLKIIYIMSLHLLQQIRRKYHVQSRY
jgi:hypothetical protein